MRTIHTWKNCRDQRNNKVSQIVWSHLDIIATPFWGIFCITQKPELQFPESAGQNLSKLILPERSSLYKKWGAGGKSGDYLRRNCSRCTVCSSVWMHPMSHPLQASEGASCIFWDSLPLVWPAELVSRHPGLLRIKAPFSECLDQPVQGCRLRWLETFLIFLPLYFSKVVQASNSL